MENVCSSVRTQMLQGSGACMPSRLSRTDGRQGKDAHAGQLILVQKLVHEPLTSMHIK